MKKNPKLRYFNFPVQLLQSFLLDYKKCLINICEYSIYSYSLNLEYGESDLVRFQSASKYYGIDFNRPEDSFDNGRMLFDSIPSKSPKTGLNTLIFLDYFNNFKSDFEIVTLLAFLAMRSIIGKKEYCKMTNIYWISRMNGNSRIITDKTQLSSEVLKYNTRHYFDKIKLELNLNWGLKDDGKCSRGYYVSYKLSLENLISKAEKRNKKYREKEYKRQQHEARKKVLKALDNICS